MEFKGESVHSHFKQDTHTVTYAGKSSAEHLLLTFKRNVGSSIVVYDMIAVLRDQPRWPNLRLQQIQRLVAG
jgi:hypothetical protein